MKVQKGIQRIANQYKNSAISTYSGQTAFFLMLSFFPFLMFFFTLLNLTPLSERDFMASASAIVPETFREAVNYLVHDIYTGSTAVTLPATIVSAVFLSSKSFISLQKGLNSVYGAKETRNPLLLRVFAILYSVVFAVFLIIVLALTVFGRWINQTFLEKIPVVGGVFETVINLRMLICIPALFLVFWILYIFLPNEKHRAKNQIPGAVFAAMGWIFFSFFFSIYVDRFSNYSSFYGTMTTIALLMVWLYGCMYVLFLGGFLNFILSKRKKP